jgi:hypothetical protein
VKILEITINAKQVVLAIWTLIAIAISLIIVLGMGFPFTVFGGSVSSGPPWWLLVAAFFGVLLVITLPVYLLVAVWGMLSKSESEQ